jgi:hypothetical protein
MKNSISGKSKRILRKVKAYADPSLPDEGGDHTGTDSDADKTKVHKGRIKGKYEKPRRETDPDRTGIDTDADKTKKETRREK